MRATVIHSLRLAAPAIFNLGNTTMYSVSYDRSKVADFQKLLASPKTPNVQYPKYPRILYQNGEVDKPGLVFRNECLPKV